MKLNRPGSGCSLNHWIMLLAFQHEPFRWEPFTKPLYLCTQRFLWAQCPARNPHWFIPLICPSCLWLIRESLLLEENWGRIQILFCSAGTALAAVWMLHQSSNWRLFLIVPIPREVLDLSVTRSCTSFSRSLEMCVTCSMFILHLCWRFFHNSAHFPTADFEILPVLLFGDWCECLRMFLFPPSLSPCHSSPSSL